MIDVVDEPRRRHAATSGLRASPSKWSCGYRFGLERMSKLTILLARAQFGEQGACEALVAAAYPRLRRLVDQRLRERGRMTVADSTELKQLYFSQLVGADELRTKDRGAFFKYIPRIMRPVLADIARARIAERRMNADESTALSTDPARPTWQDEDCIVQVREALEEELTRYKRGWAQVLEMGNCAGYSAKEIADELRVDERWAEVLLRMARVALARFMRR
jgi:DNA-directed RNA polymerase specialized sigma24 family protein